MTTFLAMPSSDRGGPFLPVFLIVLWVQLFYALFPTWLEIASYKYALIAAPLWVILAMRRWHDVPEGSLSHRVSNPVLVVILIAASLLVIGFRGLQQVDQFWRLPLWGHSLVVLVVTIALILWSFGMARSASLLRVVVLFLVLVPLPSRLEGLIAGNLTHLVTRGVADLLPLLGYPVNLLGNAMILKGELMDVAEGCSGLRSFQASVMLAAFLGEFYEHGFLRRIFLLGASLLLAVLGNGFRILYLATVVYDRGTEAEAQVHGTAGLMAITFIYGMIGLLAWFLARASFSESRVTTVRKAEQI